jgi:hypothetical protein
LDPLVQLASDLDSFNLDVPGAINGLFPILSANVVSFYLYSLDLLPLYAMSFLIGMLS